MIWFLVSDSLFLCIPPRLWPPVGCLLVFPSIRVGGLFLRLDQLDPSLCNELASSLLTVLEPLFVKVPYLLFVVDPDGLLGRDYRRWALFLDRFLMTDQARPEPLPHLRVHVIVVRLWARPVSAFRPPPSHQVCRVLKCIVIEWQLILEHGCGDCGGQLGLQRATCIWQSAISRVSPELVGGMDLRKVSLSKNFLIVPSGSLHDADVKVLVVPSSSMEATKKCRPGMLQYSRSAFSMDCSWYN